MDEPRTMSHRQVDNLRATRGVASSRAGVRRRGFCFTLALLAAETGLLVAVVSRRAEVGKSRHLGAKDRIFLPAAANNEKILRQNRILFL